METDKTKNWFSNELDQLKIDPCFIAEEALLNFTETICKAHGQPNGIYRFYIWVLEWVADKLIWRKNASWRIK